MCNTYCFPTGSQKGPQRYVIRINIAILLKFQQEQPCSLLQGVHQPLRSAKPTSVPDPERRHGDKCHDSRSLPAPPDHHHHHHHVTKIARTSHRLQTRTDIRPRDSVVQGTIPKVARHVKFTLEHAQRGVEVELYSFFNLGVTLGVGG